MYFGQNPMMLQQPQMGFNSYMNQMPPIKKKFIIRTYKIRMI